MRRPLRALSSLLLACVAASGAVAASAEAAAEVDLTGRLRAFGARSFLPGDDLVRAADGTPRDLGNADLRLTWAGASAMLDFEVAVEAGMAYDGAGQSYAPDRRALDLTTQTRLGEDVGAAARLDRLWVATDLGRWRVKLGRQALSLGNGLVFQPLDLFNPFSPVEIDRDFKAGDDLLVVSRPFDDGSEIGLFAAARRGRGGGLDEDAGSLALRWRGFVGELSVDAMAGRHLGDPLAALSLSGALGSAVWRMDLVGQRTDGCGRLSAIVNADWSFSLGGRNAYVFGEYYRSAWGLSSPSLAGFQADDALRRRVARGELFVIGRDYGALGATLEWHPLMNQSLLLLHEFAGHSQLVQTTVDWRPDDASIWQFSLVAPLGGRGEEFGRLVAGARADASPLTVGGGERLLVRWSLYF